MRIKYGSVWDTDEMLIAHGVNTVGVMGAGFARQVKERFSETHRQYVEWCKQYSPSGGSVFVGPIENDRVIVNIASQELPGPNATLPFLAEGLEHAIVIAKQYGYSSMAIVQIGCGIGGLDWKGVEQVMLALEQDYGFEFEVWIYNEE